MTAVVRRGSTPRRGCAARAVPSCGWIAATISSRRFGLVGNASIMYGEAKPFGFDEIVAARSRSTVGANGIQKSRFLIIRLISPPPDGPEGSPGSSGCPAPALRTPSAPRSARRRRRTRAARRSAPRSRVVARSPCSRLASSRPTTASISASRTSGPRYAGPKGCGTAGSAAARARSQIAEIRRAHRVRLVAAGREDEQLARPSSSSADQHVGLHVHEDAAAEGRAARRRSAGASAGSTARSASSSNLLGAAGDPVEAQARGSPRAAADSAARGARQPKRLGSPSRQSRAPGRARRRLARSRAPARTSASPITLYSCSPGLHAEQRASRACRTIRATRARSASPRGGSR